MTLCLLCRALLCSLPLLLLGLHLLLTHTLLHDSINLLTLATFLQQSEVPRTILASVPDPALPPALLLSLTSATFALHGFSERRAGPLLAAMVSLPFTAVTVAVRCLALATILALQPGGWVLILLTTLVTVTVVVRLVCTCLPLRPRPPSSCLLGPVAPLLSSAPRALLTGVVEVLCPLGYTSDPRYPRQHHPAQAGPGQGARRPAPPPQLPGGGGAAGPGPGGRPRPAPRHRAGPQGRSPPGAPTHLHPGPGVPPPPPLLPHPGRRRRAHPGDGPPDHLLPYHTLPPGHLPYHTWPPATIPHLTTWPLGHLPHHT